jgi:hypothetical protein
MELDFQSLFGLCVSLAEEPQPPPAFGLTYEGAIAYWSATIDDVSLGPLVPTYLKEDLLAEVLSYT